MPTSVCPIHGLRYDPAITAGCSRCHAASATAATTRRSFLAFGAVGVSLAAAGVAVAQRGTSPPPVPPASELTDIQFGMHHGVLFEPAGTPRTRPCPLIVLFDPAGDARGIVARYAPAARAHGWLAASCSDVRNGTPDEDDDRAMNELLSYVGARRRVDQRRVFSGGHSGGACGAYRFAIVSSASVAGAIVECGHMGPWREVGDRAIASSRFYLFTRLNDFNRPATRALQQAMAAKGCRVTEVEAPGGHAPMTSDQVDAALRWMEAV